VRGFLHPTAVWGANPSAAGRQNWFVLGHGWPRFKWLFAGVVQRGPSCGTAAGWCQREADDFIQGKKFKFYNILLTILLRTAKQS